MVLAGLDISNKSDINNHEFDITPSGVILIYKHKSTTEVQNNDVCGLLYLE